MNIRMAGRACALAVVSIAFIGCPRSQEPNHREALRNLRADVEGMQPTIASLTGIKKGGPVPVDLLTRAEFSVFLERCVKVEYPHQELKRRGRALALIGLLPQGYDLEHGFIALLKQHAGAMYDLRSRTLIGLSDLPPEDKRDVNDRMILAHELTHALQGRVVDMAGESEKALRDLDYEYALRAILEGMASSVMIACAQNLRRDELPDLQKFWRSQLSRYPGETLSGFPRYVSEYLMSPYAEGGAFIQAWQEENPAKSPGEIFDRMPASGEQVLHYEKFVDGDLPTLIDLSRVHGMLPGDWTLSYANTLGEFELRVLFQCHDDTKKRATELAAGWDGCLFETYENAHGNVILIGSSVWDCQKDAEEFCDGFRRVLEGCRPGGDHEVLQSNAQASFVIGLSDKALRTRILKSCGVIG